MLSITKKFTFEASHRLHNINLTNEENKEIFNKCNNEPSHGHSYKLYVTVTSQSLTNGMIMNFSDLKEIVNKYIVEDLDHHFLNDVSWLNSLTTCENMLLKISIRLKLALPKDIKLVKLRLYETETSCGEWNE